MPKLIRRIDGPRYQNPRDAGKDPDRSLADLVAMHPAVSRPLEVWQIDFRGEGTFRLCTASPGSPGPDRYLSNLSRRERAAVVGYHVVGTINPKKGKPNA